MQDEKYQICILIIIIFCPKNWPRKWKFIQLAYSEKDEFLQVSLKHPFFNEYWPCKVISSYFKFSACFFDNDKCGHIPI